MRIVIINCFDTYEDRVDLLYDFFANKGNEITVIQSKFRHFKKVNRIDSKKNFIFIESKPYYKNLSFNRIKSHYKFAKDAFKLVEKLKPDLLYAIIPPNSITKFAALYKKKHSNIKLILDLIDLWPETMPIGKIKSLPPFSLWRLLRDTNIKYADYIITECDLYQTILKTVLHGMKTKTIYLAKRDMKIDFQSNLNANEIHLCYLGSINNIIDIAKIKDIIKLVHKRKYVTLHIIGDGESKDIFINQIIDTGAKVEYYGEVYDSIKKQEIFSKCHFGINIMKESVCVGLTMKSVDYFQHGLPILNNIKSDTTEILNHFKIGINISDENINDVAERIVCMSKDEFLEMRMNSIKVFDKMFSVESFKYKLEEVFSDLKIN